MTEYRDKARGLFWTDACANPTKAIEFALSDIRDDGQRVEFLQCWSEGDVHEYPEFIKLVGDGEKTP